MAAGEGCGGRGTRTKAAGEARDNPAAIAAYRKAGFVEEGRRREAVFRGGRWIDHVQMGILAGEWRH